MIEAIKNHEYIYTFYSNNLTILSVIMKYIPTAWLIDYFNLLHQKYSKLIHPPRSILPLLGDSPTLLSADLDHERNFYSFSFHLESSSRNLQHSCTLITQ
jgi:hypothetical protein